MKTKSTVGLRFTVVKLGIFFQEKVCRLEVLRSLKKIVQTCKKLV